MPGEIEWLIGLPPARSMTRADAWFVVSQVINTRSSPANAAWTDESKAIFMVALDTGQLIASVEFDSTGANGPTEMKFSIPSAPAVFDINGDGWPDLLAADMSGTTHYKDKTTMGAMGSRILRKNVTGSSPARNFRSSV